MDIAVDTLSDNSKDKVNPQGNKVQFQGLLEPVTVEIKEEITDLPDSAISDYPNTVRVYQPDDHQQ